MPTARASSSAMAQPMSSWQRTYVIHAVVDGGCGTCWSACEASRTSPEASIDQICTISPLW